MKIINYGTFIGEIFKYNKFKKLINNTNININNMNNNFGMTISNNNNILNNNMNFGMPISYINNNMNFGMGMTGIPNNNMMMNNNFNNFDMGNNMMMNNINNNNFGIPINNWQNMMNYNELNNNSFFNDRLKKNVIFQDEQGHSTNMSFNYDTTIDEMLKKYIKRINRPDLYVNNKIYFLYNAERIRFGDKTPIKVFFKNAHIPKVYVCYLYK